MSNDFMEKMAEVNPQIKEFLQKTAAEVNASQFRTEILGELNGIIEKAAMDWKSGLKGVAGTLKGPAAAMGGILAGGVAMHLGADLYDAARRGLTKSRNYKNMLQANPDIAEQAAENPEVIKSHFNTLHRFNPEFSGDPSIAASYVRQGLGFGTDLNTASALVTARKNIRDARAIKSPGPNPFKSRVEQDQARAQLDKTRADTEKTRADIDVAKAKVPGGLTVRQRAYHAGNPRAYASGNP